MVSGFKISPLDLFNISSGESNPKVIFEKELDFLFTELVNFVFIVYI